MKYADWMRKGIAPPPVSVFDSGNGGFVSTNRRRVLAAQQAGMPLVGWHGPTNKETNLPLKHGDVMRAFEEASKPPAPVAPVDDDLTDDGYKNVLDFLDLRTRDDLQRARPLLAALWPEHTHPDSDDPWGITRAIAKGDEIPRIPTADLSRRIRASMGHPAVQEAMATEGKYRPANPAASAADPPPAQPSRCKPSRLPRTQAARSS